MEDSVNEHFSSNATLTGWQERRILLRDFKQEAREHFNLSVGFALLWTWVWLIFQTTYLSPSFFENAAIRMPSWVLPLAAYALAFAALGFLLKIKGCVPHSKKYRLGIPLAMSLGISVCGILFFFPLDPTWLNNSIIVAAALVIGSATACLHVEWGRALGNLGPKKTIIHGIIGTILAALLLVSITALPPAAIWVFATIIPPLSMGFLLPEIRKHPHLFSHGITTKANVPWRFLLTSFLQGSSFGIFQVLLLMGSHQAPSVLITGVSFTFSALILLACAFFFKMDFNQLIYQIGFVIASFGYLLFALIGVDNPLALFAHGVGYRFIDIMMWALCTYLVKQHNISANWVFAWTTCALLLGQVCGALFGNAFFLSTNFAPGSTLALSVVMVFVLLTGSLFLSNRRNLKTGWGMVRPGHSEALLNDFDMGCKLVSRQHNLTEREEEVFMLLAKGLSRNQLCETLVLSKGTIKTHIRNIYKKMDIHSQQEAFFIVEKTQKEFGLDEEVKHDMRL